MHYLTVKIDFFRKINLNLKSKSTKDPDPMNVVEKFNVQESIINHT